MTTNRYKITKLIKSGTLAGLTVTCFTDFPMEVGFTHKPWAYGPAYEVIACEKISCDKA